MYLVNALSFVADWQEQYEEYQMRPAAFYAPEGEREGHHDALGGAQLYQRRGLHGFMKPYEGGRYAFAACCRTGTAAWRPCSRR